MELKPLTEKNVPEILNLIKQTMLGIYDLAFESLNNNWQNRKMWGIWVDKELVACCGILRQDGHSYLSWFAVKPSLQRSRVGEFMLAFLLRKIKYNVYVETYIRPDFASANAFYIKHGFKFFKHVDDMITYRMKR